MGDGEKKGSGVFVLLAAALLHLFLPVGAALGWIGFGEGARYFVPAGGLKIAWYLTLFIGFAHVFLVFPVTHWAAPEMRSRHSMAVRLIGLTALFSAPLLSFAHYLGQLRTGLDYFEAALVVIPAAVLAALAYEVFEDRLTSTLVLTLGVFPAFFVVNDVLGPFTVYWSYVPQGGAFYWLRAACPPLAIGLSVGWLFRSAPDSHEARLDRVRSQLLVLALLSAVASLASFPQSTVSWLWLLSCWHFARDAARPSRALVAAGLGLVVIPLVVALRLPGAQPGVASFVSFSIDLLVFGALLSIFWALVDTKVHAKPRPHLEGAGVG